MVYWGSSKIAVKNLSIISSISLFSKELFSLLLAVGWSCHFVTLVYPCVNNCRLYIHDLGQNKGLICGTSTLWFAIKFSNFLSIMLSSHCPHSLTCLLAICCWQRTIFLHCLHGQSTWLDKFEAISTCVAQSHLCLHVKWPRWVTIYAYQSLFKVSISLIISLNIFIDSTNYL